LLHSVWAFNEINKYAPYYIVLLRFSHFFTEQTLDTGTAQA